MNRAAQLPLILFLALFFTLWTVRATVLIPIDQSIQSSEARSIYSTSVKTTLWLLSAMGFVKWVRKMSPFPYLGLGALPERKTWVRSIVAIFLFCALVLAFEIFLGRNLPVQPFLRLALFTKQVGVAFHGRPCRQQHPVLLDQVGVE